MESYDLSHKLAYLGRRCPIPFTTGPQYTNSIPGVPVLSQVRVFVDRTDWTVENIQTVAREIARVLGAIEQFDVGITVADVTAYDAAAPVNGLTARVMKLDRNDPHVQLRIAQVDGDMVYRARFPRLQFEPVGEDFWQSIYAPGVVKVSGQL